MLVRPRFIYRLISDSLADIVDTECAAADEFVYRCCNTQQINMLDAFCINLEICTLAVSLVSIAFAIDLLNHIQVGQCKTLKAGL